MSIEKCSETTDSQDEAQLEQRGEVSAANSPNLVVFFRKGVGSMPARRDPLSSCSLISKALLEQKGCIDDIGQDDGTSDKCSHGARIGIFERSIERGDADIEVTFCVVEHEMIYPIIVGKDVQDVLDIPDVDATVAEGRPFGPLHLGRETEEQKQERKAKEKKRKADTEDQCSASNEARNKKPRSDDKDNEGRKSKEVAI